MSEITNVLEVWDNGVLSPEFGEIKKAQDDPVDWINKFCESTGAKHPVATRWTYHGETYESAFCPKPLYQSNCLVEFRDDARELVVLNPDNTVRHKLRPVWNLLKIPITEEFKRNNPHRAFTPAHRKLGYYPASLVEAGSEKFSVVCDDGIGDTFCLYDVRTGALVSFSRTRY